VPLSPVPLNISRIPVDMTDKNSRAESGIQGLFFSIFIAEKSCSAGKCENNLQDNLTSTA
jgi:hypothetical protein